MTLKMHEEGQRYSKVLSEIDINTCSMTQIDDSTLNLYDMDYLSLLKERHVYPMKYVAFVYPYNVIFYGILRFVCKHYFGAGQTGDYVVWGKLPSSVLLCRRSDMWTSLVLQAYHLPRSLGMQCRVPCRLSCPTVN